MFCLLVAYSVATTAENTCNEGYIIGTLFAILIVTRLLDELFGQKLLNRLRTVDTLSNQVSLRLFGKVWLWGKQLFFLVLLFNSICIDSVTLSTVFFMVSLAHGVFLINVLSTKVEITESTISYKTAFQSSVIDTSMISNICWISYGRSFGYSLVLKLTNGKSIEFPQIYFVGLNDLWERYKDE